MRKFEKILKNNWTLILGVIIGIIGGFAITLIVNADTILFASTSVEYSPSNGLTSTTVQGPIDKLYTKYTNLWCKSGFVKDNATSTSGGTLPTTFGYKNTTSNIANAARLITAQEIMRGCSLTQVGSFTTGELSGCNFLFERTRYSYQESTWTTNGPWLETPHASYSNCVWIGNPNLRNANYTVVFDADFGVRPTIDVPKSKLK